MTAKVAFIAAAAITLAMHRKIQELNERVFRLEYENGRFRRRYRSGDNPVIEIKR